MSSKTIEQYRFYTSGNEHNYPDDSDENMLTKLKNGTYFSYVKNSNKGPIVKLGIQALPGTKFYLNGDSQPMIVGTTGIFELNFLDENIGISSLIFDEDSLNRISDAQTGFLIIDVIYDKEAQISK